MFTACLSKVLEVSKAGIFKSLMSVAESWGLSFYLNIFSGKHDFQEDFQGHWKPFILSTIDNDSGFCEFGSCSFFK